MSVRSLDATTLDLHGLQLIEASAGTGKTWTIAALYLRLVLEAELPVERILVVTYTRAATAELRERIRARLVAAQLAFDAAQAPTDDVVLAALWPRLDAARARRLLTLALESFDLASIHTIHGFCQRALAERAFESGADFDNVISSDDGRRLREAAEDFWRQEIASASVFWARWLMQALPGPASLLAALRPHFGKPYLSVRPAPAVTADERAFVAAWEAAAHLWQSQGAAALQALQEFPHLNRTSHKPEQIADAAASVALWLESEMAVLPLPKNLAKLTSSVLQAKTKSKQTPPQHDLFDALQRVYDEGMALQAALEARLSALLQRAWQACEQAAREKKQQAGERSFDDLLLDLHTALCAEGGEVLASALRRRYGAALIDEFQDTDPLQYAIFMRLFAPAPPALAMPLFLVGDPKQAIYSFRGADLFAYLKARSDAGQPWALDVNRRSRPKLVAAVNALFMQHATPFMVASLDFVPVQASAQPPQALLIEGKEAPVFEFWCLQREEADKLLGKTETAPQIAAAVADDIARLINLGSIGEASIGKHALNGGDIAILVKSHSQGRRMHEALLARGIPCVRYGQDSVYASAEALAIERILLAVAEPGRESLVRAALVSDLLGWRGADLLALEAADERALQQRQRFYDYHAQASAHGFIRMWRMLLQDFGVAARLLALPEGERRMTNLQHLSDLLQTLAHDEGIGVEALAKHLADERAGMGDEENGEAKLLRLESDEAVVKIVTIHSSKGLEYPVVYCPFLWDGAQRRASMPLRFHDAAADNLSCIDFGSSEWETHAARAEEEAREEALRLAYVALTRAKHRCVTLWGALKDADKSPLAWLLYGRLPTQFAKSSDDEVMQPLKALAQACPDIQLCPMPQPAEARQMKRSASTAVLAARSFPPRPLLPWHMHSYSAWAASAAHARPNTVRFVAELPDYDADVILPAGDDVLSADEFPCGSEAGSCLHALLQHADFSAPRVEAGSLQAFAIEARHAPVAEALLSRVLTTPLSAAGPRLADLALAQQQREMPFVLPLARPDLSILAQAIGANEGADGHLAERVRALQAPALAGFLKGFIDLVFLAGERYCIADYKSNRLGATPAAYAAPSLAQAMAAANYDLQALLYTLALHRLLQWRLPDYDYDKHIGGAYYLFLRGMQPAHPGSGVHVWRPSRALVERVDACLLRTEALLTC